MALLFLGGGGNRRRHNIPCIFRDRMNPLNVMNEIRKNIGSTEMPFLKYVRKPKTTCKTNKAESVTSGVLAGTSRSALLCYRQFSVSTHDCSWSIYSLGFLKHSRLV